MKTTIKVWASLLIMFMMAGCLVEPGRRGEVSMAPLLPPVVVLEAEPYYYHEGYHYYYHDNGWYYARSRKGPWVALPRDHYPREVRYKYGGEERDRR